MESAESMQASVLIVAAAFLTSILSGIFGMAGGIVFMGVLTWLLPAALALALHGVIQFASNLWRFLLHRRHVAWPVLLWFGLGSAVSLAFFSLVLFSPTKLLVFLGLGLTPILVWLPERWIRLDADNRWHAIGGGFVSNGVSLISGVSGPISDLLFVNTSLNRHQVVATKAVMQAMGHASKIIVYGALLLAPSARQVIALPATFAAVAAAMAGIMVGCFILDRISDAQFRAMRRWLVTAVGLAFLVQAIRIAIA